MVFRYSHHTFVNDYYRFMENMQLDTSRFGLKICFGFKENVILVQNFVLKTLLTI